MTVHAAPKSFIAPNFFEAPVTNWPFNNLEPQAYDFIMIDPAWRFENYSEKGQAKGPEPHYRTMDVVHLAQGCSRNRYHSQLGI